MKLNCQPNALSTRLGRHLDLSYSDYLMPSRTGAFLLACAILAAAALQANPSAGQTESGLERRARMLMGSQQWESAAQLYERIVDTDPSNWRALFQLGLAYHRLEAFDKAIEVYDRAARFDAVAAPSMYNRACAQAILGRGDEAILSLREAKAAGFRDLDLARTDSDLEDVRARRDFPFRSPHQMKRLTLESGGTLSYGLALPTDYDPEGTYPILIAMPPGGEGRQNVDWGMVMLWGREATERDWIVASPIRPAGGWHGDRSSDLMGELLDALENDHQLEEGRFHLVGCSSGGVSAFRVALDQPDRFQSLTCLPGTPRDDDFARLNRLNALTVAIFVSDDDGVWSTGARATAAQLEAEGVAVSLRMLPGEGHVPRSLLGDGLMSYLDSLRGRAD